MQRTWIEIKRSALLYNIDQLSEFIAPSNFAAVIKANAYGHGLLQIADVLKDCQKVSSFCVAQASEALQLRAAGVQKPILVLSAFCDDDIKMALEHNIEFAVYSFDLLHYLESEAQKQHKSVSIHLKFDTGMNRSGFNNEEIMRCLEKIKNSRFIRLIGIMTHVCNKDSQDTAFTQFQLKQFNQLIEQLSLSHLQTHALSSGALEFSPAHNYSCARVGTNMYGFWSSEASRQRALVQNPNISLLPVLVWKTRIMQVKKVPKGATVGYACTFKAPRDMTIAILPVGYWDGYPRALSNKGVVSINGKHAPVIGMVSMNLMTIDVTEISAKVHDEVTLLGDIIWADFFSSQINTINIECTTRINPLIERIIVD